MEQHQQQQQQQQQRYHSHRGGVSRGRGNSSPRGGRGGGGGRGGNRGGDYSPSFHDQHRQRNNLVVTTKRGGGVGGGRGGSGPIQSIDRRSTPTTSGAISTLTQQQLSAESQTTENVVWPEKFLRELCHLLAERNLLTELCNLSRVCKAWNTIASEDDLWKWIFQKQWKDPVPLNLSEKERRWKELYAAKVRFSVSHLLTYFDLDEEPTDYGEEDQPAAYSDYLDLMGDSNAICSSFEELDLYEVHLKDVSYSSSSSKHKHHYPPTLEVNEKEHIVIAQNKSVDYILLLDISHFEGLATPQNPKVVLWEMLPNNNNNNNEAHHHQEEAKQQMICNEYNISETFLHFLYQNCFHKWEMNYNQDAYPFSEELFSTLRLEYVEENHLMQIASGLGFESLFFSDAHNFCGVSKDEDALIFYSKGRMIFDICTESKELLSHYRDAIKSQLRRPSPSSSSSSYSSSPHYHHHHHSPHHHHHQQQHPYNQHHYQQSYDQRHHQQQYRYNQQHQPQHLRPYYQQPPHYQQQYYQQEQHYYPYYMPPQPGFPYMPPPPYQSGPYQAAPFNYAEVYQPQSPHQQHHHHHHNQYTPQFDVNYPGDEEGEDTGDAYYHHGDEEEQEHDQLSDNRNYAGDDPSSQFSAMNLHAQQHPTSSTT